MPQRGDLWQTAGQRGHKEGEETDNLSTTTHGEFGVKKKNRWWKVCHNILLHGPCLPQRQWLSTGSGKADCVEVKGQLRGERDTRRQVGRGRKELRMPNFQKEGPIVVTTKLNFSWYRIYEASTHVNSCLCSQSKSCQVWDALRRPPS